MIARLIDEPPTAAEAGHLAACTECAAELESMRAEHDALATLPRILPVPTAWEAMRLRLERDGLLSGGTRRHAGWMPGIAAALALFLAGGATGVGVARLTAHVTATVPVNLEIWRDGQVHEQSYERGHPRTPLQMTGTTKRRGTKITFHPDPGIFKLTEFSFEQLSQRLDGVLAGRDRARGLPSSVAWLWEASIAMAVVSSTKSFSAATSASTLARSRRSVSASAAKSRASGRTAAPFRLETSTSTSVPGGLRSAAMPRRRSSPAPPRRRRRCSSSGLTGA